MRSISFPAIKDPLLRPLLTSVSGIMSLISRGKKMLHSSGSKNEIIPNGSIRFSMKKTLMTYIEMF